MFTKNNINQNVIYYIECQLQIGYDLHRDISWIYLNHSSVMTLLNLIFSYAKGKIFLKIKF